MSNISIDITTTRRDIALQPARWIAAAMAAAATAFAAWWFALPLWACAVLATTIAAFLTQELWHDPDGVVSRVRMGAGMVVIEDRKTRAGEARAVLLGDIARTQRYDIYLTLHLRAGGHDGTLVRKPDVAHLTSAIDAALHPEAP